MAPHKLSLDVRLILRARGHTDTSRASDEKEEKEAAEEHYDDDAGKWDSTVRRLAGLNHQNTGRQFSSACSKTLWSIALCCLFILCE